jgi:hypothetical protein
MPSQESSSATALVKALHAAALSISGAVFLLPAQGLLSRSHLRALYDVPVDAPDVEILLRHRAVLFAAIGAYLLYASARTLSAFKTTLPLRNAARAGGLLCALSFIGVARAVGGYNAAVSRVVVADWVISALLIGSHLIDKVIKLS